ncbi:MULTISPECIES: YhgE/Pip family protein [unclassified Rathayibacter]|uniref:YhgE/Pip family protein n=1 Tax=unclassified Rathayibacter TaxID=2609250 RepID=UPI00188B820B|nr:MULTISPECIES: YhgE/Pip domain-containing protein [unclassified Rathayibacter]MBF4463141.1 YhgE/Pip domain-containing protein [Rathayibacter sp. VKM Ac-2879]MBF4504622.1 YhgE/Pip domain-containing protein [Rathayibacter sp. VKM Ac-2878]
MTTSPLRRALRRVNPRLLVVFAAIALIPLIYAGLLTSANLDPTHHLDTVPAALVDEDTGATASDGSALALGHDLADELTSNTSGSNFAWHTTGADEAASELASGAVYAVLTVPADFSADVASIGGDDPSAAATAKLSIETNDGANLIVGSIANTVGTSVTQAVEKKVGEKYLSSIYLGFTELHAKLEQASDGASQLAEGAGRAADGSSELVVGLTQLQDGSARLADGADALRAGADSAASGAAALSSGLQKLDDGASQLPAKADELASGAQKVAAGAQQLDSGAAGLASGASDLAAGTSSLSTGATTAATGAAAVSKGAGTVSGGAEEALTAARQLASGGASLASATPTLAAGSAAVDSALSSLLTRYDSMNDAERRTELTAIERAAAAVSTGAADADHGAHALDAGTKALVGDSDHGLTALAAGAAQLAGGAAELSNGAGTLASGAAAVDTGAQALSSGATTLASGASSLDAGAAGLSSGVDALVDGVGPLSGGIADADSGASRLASGTADLASGADTLAAGAASASSGTAAAESGSERLAGGIESLRSGSSTLGASLADGAKQIPSYTSAQASALSAVAAAPVGLDAERLNRVPSYGYGLAPYFMALALWVGALAFYLMSAPLNARLLAGRRPAWVIALRSYLPGALMAVAQGVLAALVIRFGVGVEATNLPGLIGIAVLTSLTFVAVNQALIALLDAPGRFLALLMIVLQLSSAGGTYPVETAPAFFQALHGVLPLTGTVEAFRSLIAGGSIGVAHAVLVLLLWLAGALAVTVLAAGRRRRRGLAPALPDPEPLLPA